MDDKLFQELLESIREGGRMLRGEQVPARSYKVENCLCLEAEGVDLNLTRDEILHAIQEGRKYSYQQENPSAGIELVDRTPRTG